MRVVDYSPAYAEQLSSAFKIAKIGRLIRSEKYLNHLYLGHPRRRLHLLLSDDEQVIATLGTETIPFRLGAQTLDISVGSNTYSLKPGAFSFLMHHWMRSAQFGLFLPSTPAWGAMLAKQSRWQSIPGLKSYFLNWNYPIFEDDPAWKRALKPCARLVTRVNSDSFVKKVVKSTAGELNVVEVDGFSEDTVGRNGNFGLRTDTDTAYLNWRFSTKLDYVKYRVFKIINGRATRGYVVLADWPHCLVVAHCDGDDAEELALGVLLSISAVNRDSQRYRRVMLTSIHEVMAGVFRRFGFRAKQSDYPFYLSAFGDRTLPLTAPADWLVNMDLGDYGAIVGSTDLNGQSRVPLGT